MSVPCKIVLADDHTLFRNGLRTLLGGIEGFEVVAEASNGLEFAGTVGKKPARRRAPRYRDAQDERHRGCRRGAQTVARPEDHHVVHVRRRGLLFPHGVARRQGIHPEKLRYQGCRGRHRGRRRGRELLLARASFQSGQQPEVGAFGRSRTTVPSSCRSASPRFCCISAGASRTTRSPTRCSFPSGRSTSIARTFWPRRVVRIRPIWSFTRSKTIWSRSDLPALHSVSGEAFSVRLVSARSCFAWRRRGILIFLALRV